MILRSARCLERSRSSCWRVDQDVEIRRVADFGMDHVVDLVKQTEFPWLMSNVYDNVTENTMADGYITHMITWQGRKVGGVRGATSHT